MAFWGSLQLKFGLSYIAVIAAVLLLLNTYPLLVSEDLGVPLQGDDYDRQRVGGGVFSGGPEPAESGKRGGCHGSGGGDRDSAEFW